MKYKNKIQPQSLRQCFDGCWEMWCPRDGSCPGCLLCRVPPAPCGHPGTGKKHKQRVASPCRALSCRPRAGCEHPAVLTASSIMQSLGWGEGKCPHTGTATTLAGMVLESMRSLGEEAVVQPPSSSPLLLTEWIRHQLESLPEPQHPCPALLW